MGQAQINKMRFQKEHRSHSGAGTGHLSCKLIFAFSKLKTSASQFSTLKPHKTQKSQILNLTPEIFNPELSNLKSQNLKSQSLRGGRHEP